MSIRPFHNLECANAIFWLMSKLSLPQSEAELVRTVATLLCANSRAHEERYPKDPNDTCERETYRVLAYAEQQIRRAMANSRHTASCDDRAVYVDEDDALTFWRLIGSSVRCDTCQLRLIGNGDEARALLKAAAAVVPDLVFPYCRCCYPRLTLVRVHNVFFAGHIGAAKWVLAVAASRSTCPKPALPLIFGGEREAVLHTADAEALRRWGSALDGWNSGPDEARHPFTFEDVTGTGRSPAEEPAEPAEPLANPTNPRDFDEPAPARGHAADFGASEAYREYVRECEDEDREPKSFDTFCQGGASRR